jgi:hypothetical protein
MSICLSEMLWIKNLLLELKLREGPMKLWGDNRSAIIIANNPVQHDRTKHVEIDRFFIKERLDDGTLKLSHIASGEQIADCLTKGLGVKDCVDDRYTSPILRGSVELYTYLDYVYQAQKAHVCNIYKLVTSE